MGRKDPVIGSIPSLLIGVEVGVGGANIIPMRSSQGTDSRMPFTLNSTDTESICTRSPVRICSDFNLIQICRGFGSEESWVVGLSCAGAEIYASERTTINMVIRFNGFTAEPF